MKKRLASIVTAVAMAVASVMVVPAAQALPTTPAPTKTESGRDVTVEDGYFTSGDQYGTQIYYKTNKVTNPVGNAMVIHGMAEHLGRFEYVTEKLNNAGFNVYRLDHRGHGKSAAPYADNEIEKGQWDDYQNVLDDMNILVNMAKTDYPELKNIMVGHSLGAFATQGYALKYPDQLDATVTNGGGIPFNLSGKVGEVPVEVLSEEISQEMVDSFSIFDAIPWTTLTSFNAQAITNALEGKNFHVPTPPGLDKITIPNPNGPLISAAHDPAVMDDISNDPYSSSELGLGLLLQTVALMIYNSINAPEMVLPTKISHGDKDELVPVGMDYNWYNAISSADKEFTVYQGQMHEVWNDYAKDEALDAVVAWMLDHI